MKTPVFYSEHGLVKAADRSLPTVKKIIEKNGIEPAAVLYRGRATPSKLYSEDQYLLFMSFANPQHSVGLGPEVAL